MGEVLSWPQEVAHFRDIMCNNKSITKTITTSSSTQFNCIKKHAPILHCTVFSVIVCLMMNYTIVLKCFTYLRSSIPVTYLADVLHNRISERKG